MREVSKTFSGVHRFSYNNDNLPGQTLLRRVTVDHFRRLFQSAHDLLVVLSVDKRQNSHEEASFRFKPQNIAIFRSGSLNEGEGVWLQHEKQ